MSFGNIANMSFVNCDIVAISVNENVFLTGRNKEEIMIFSFVNLIVLLFIMKFMRDNEDNVANKIKKGNEIISCLLVDFVHVSQNSKPQKIAPKIGVSKMKSFGLVL